MYISAQKEQFSLAYVHAVASVAGFALGEYKVDDDSVDVTIKAKGMYRRFRSPRLDLQLKCTASPSVVGEEIRFALSKKNYDDLRHVEYTVPRYLVVMTVPTENVDWVSQDALALTLRHCAYWTSLAGLPESPNVDSVTVPVPLANVFDVAGLLGLVELAGGGLAA